MRVKLRNRMWFSVGRSLIDDTRPHIGQNVVDSWRAAEWVYSKHLMTGPSGNNEFCLPETLNVPLGEWDNYFPIWRVATEIEERAAERGRPIFGAKLECSNFPFVILICLYRIINQFSCWRINAYSSEKRCPTSMADWHTNLPPFQGARPDHVRVESSSCCFPREIVSFVRPRELVRFDQWHVTHSPPIGKRIWVGRYCNKFWPLWRGMDPRTGLEENLNL